MHAIQNLVSKPNLKNVSYFSKRKFRELGVYIGSEVKLSKNRLSKSHWYKVLRDIDSPYECSPKIDTTKYLLLSI